MDSGAGDRVDTAVATPAVSVVMPVFNGGRYLHDSIRSILGQKFDDFEFIVLDDGSTDNSMHLLSEWAARDRRLRLHRSGYNLGLARSSNHVVALARAPLVARMDADDVSHPDRLRRQWEAMRDSGVALVGTLSDGIDRDGRRVRPRDRWRLRQRSRFAPFPHGSIMFRRALFNEVGGYSEAYKYFEDADFYRRLAEHGRVVVIPEVLYHYRYHIESASVAMLAGEMAQALNLLDGEPPVYQEHYHKPGDCSDGEEQTLKKIPPDIFYRLGAVRLWAGHSPGILSPVLRHGAIGWNRATIRTLLWAVGGSVSPSALRWLLYCSIKTRDHIAGRRLPPGELCEWRSEWAG